MGDEIEIISDGEGIVVNGSKSAVQRFLEDRGWLSDARPFDLNGIGKGLNVASDILGTLSEVADQSSMYLKLTPESAKQLREAGGLMKTKTKGISHAMLGKTGDASMKWLQVQDGPTSLLTNPAVLTGVSGLMSQAAQQAEAQELKALLIRMDEKLDDVRRAQRDTVLAKMRAAAAEISEAMTIHTSGGDPNTLWDKVSGVSSDIKNVQEDALAALMTIAEKVEGKAKPGQLKQVTKEIGQEVALWLSVLASCFELQDEFRIIELDHVLAVAPQNLEGHREGLSQARQERRNSVLERTRHLMAEMDRAGVVVNANIVLHSRAAKKVIESLNATAELVDEFHQPLGIETSREKLDTVAWPDAIKDWKQLKAAGKEVGIKVGTVGVSIGVAIGFEKLIKMLPDQEDQEDQEEEPTEI